MKRDETRLSVQRAVSLTLSVLSACSAGPDGAPAEPADRLSLAASSSTLPPREIDALRIETPLQIGCEIRTAGAVDPGATLTLYASLPQLEENRRLLSVRYEAATFALPLGDADASLAGVEATGWGLSIRGLIRTSDVPVWVQPSRSLAGGVIRPGSTRVKIVTVHQGSAVVRLDTSKLIGLASTPLDEDLPCTDLVATAPTPAPGAFGKDVRLDASAGLEVLPLPTSTPGSGIELRTPTTEASVHLLLDAVETQRAGSFVRVEIPLHDATVVGWVPVGALRPTPTGASTGMLGSLSSATRRAPPTEAPGTVTGWTCDTPLRWAVLSPGTDPPYWVGEVRPGTPVGEPPPREPGHEAPQPPPGWVGVRLTGTAATGIVVRASDLARCARQARGAP